jgi:DNA-binding MarR family transcriptional regulator
MEMVLVSAPAAPKLRSRLEDTDYLRLLEFRTGIRRFLRWSREQAAAAGLTPAHHQLLLAIRGHGDPRGPTIGEVADYLLLRHHSAVELVDRAASVGLVKRAPDPDDQRVVRLKLTPHGTRRLERLAALHLEELGRMVPRMQAIWKGLEDTGGPGWAKRRPRPKRR